jgi:hypothetical protein
MKFKGIFSSRKGQMSAPFELFVAVIIMAFVIIIGSQMLSAANREVCVNNIDKQLSDFKSNIENTANYKNSTKFLFENPDKCFNEKNAKINITHVAKNARLCALVCGRAEESCFILNFVISKDGISKQKCLNINKFTTFMTGETTSACDSATLGVDGYVAISPENSLPTGSYILRNVSNPGEPFPKVCTFYRK